MESTSDRQKGGLSERHQNEIEHGRHLAESGQPEVIWNWGSPAGQVRAKRRAQLIAEAAGLAPGKQALEVGCGTGLFSELMLPHGAHILAVDISPDLIDLAKGRKLPEDQVDFRAISFEYAGQPTQFDAIVGSSVLHHLEMIPA
ncbi:MAG: methyltransferase, partial [Chloroflexi bacterium]|nr:methyltransferase [Chloroflexota bacterium]